MPPQLPIVFIDYDSEGRDRLTINSLNIAGIVEPSPLSQNNKVQIFMNNNLVFRVHVEEWEKKRINSVGYTDYIKLGPEE